jgi:hypothetical protein
MSHILRRMGVAALQFRQAGERRVIGPILGRRQLKDIREQWLAEGKGWPYEDIYPGACALLPPARACRRRRGCGLGSARPLLTPPREPGHCPPARARLLGG